MQPRLDPTKVAPEGYKAMLAFQAYVNNCGLEASLLELVKIRASQINGCAYCLHKHMRDAQQMGVSEDCLFLLDAWRESPVYSERERAALEWTEAVTLVAEERVPDAVYDAVRRQFSERELVDLTYAVIAINGFNRLRVGLRGMPDTAAAKPSSAR